MNELSSYVSVFNDLSLAQRCTDATQEESLAAKLVKQHEEAAITVLQYPEVCQLIDPSGSTIGGIATQSWYSVANLVVSNIKYAVIPSNKKRLLDRAVFWWESAAFAFLHNQDLQQHLLVHGIDIIEAYHRIVTRWERCALTILDSRTLAAKKSGEQTLAHLAVSCWESSRDKVMSDPYLSLLTNETGRTVYEHALLHSEKLALEWFELPNIVQIIQQGDPGSDLVSLLLNYHEAVARKALYNKVIRTRLGIEYLGVTVIAWEKLAEDILEDIDVCQIGNDETLAHFAVTKWQHLANKVFQYPAVAKIRSSIGFTVAHRAALTWRSAAEIALALPEFAELADNEGLTIAQIAALEWNLGNDSNDSPSSQDDVEKAYRLLEQVQQHLTPYHEFEQPIFFITTENNALAVQRLYQELSSLQVTDLDAAAMIREVGGMVDYALSRHFRWGVFGFMKWLIIVSVILAFTISAEPPFYITFGVLGSVVLSFLFVQYIPGWKIKHLLVRGKLYHQNE